MLSIKNDTPIKKETVPPRDVDLIDFLLDAILPFLPRPNEKGKEEEQQCSHQKDTK